MWDVLRYRSNSSLTLPVKNVRIYEEKARRKPLISEEKEECKSPAKDGEA